MSAFNNMAGLQSEVKSGTNKYTGLAPAKLMAINPNQAELSKLLGNDISWEPKYPTIPGTDGQPDKFPLTFWVKHAEKDHFTTMTIYVANSPITSKNGKHVFVNKVGQASYYAESAQALIDNQNTSWYNKEGLRPMNIGENELYALMQTIVRFNPNEDGADWESAMKQDGITMDRLVKGDVSGLRKFIEYANSETPEKQPNCFICLYCVKRKDVTTPEGTTTKYYQNILGKSESWFRTTNCEVTPSNKAKLRKVIEDRRQQGYELSTNAMYTIDFQDFNEADCENSQAPADNAAPASAAKTQAWV